MTVSTLGNAQPLPGDLVLTHRTHVTARLIGHVQARRYPPEYARWTHAAILTSTDGDLVEAWWNGVRRSNLHEYDHIEHVIVPMHVDVETRDRVVAFATHQVGRQYGYAEIASIWLYLETPSKMRFGIDGQMICSGLAAGAESRTDAIFPMEPQYALPADLARYYLANVASSGEPPWDFG